VLIRFIADGLVIPIVLIGAWALLFKVPNNNHFAAYSRVLMAGLTAYVFAKLIGNIYQPELQRPFELLGTEAGASFLNNPGFPSDHVLFCAAITLAVWFETRHRSLAVTLTILTVLVALGRVTALVHSTLDVVGALAIASIGAIWYLMREQEPTVKQRYTKQSSKPQKAGTI
jgi:membrane-associated phospholipid phosphatase